MIRVEKNIDAALGDWGDMPVFLEVSQARGVRTISSLEFSQRIIDAASQLRSWGIRERYLERN